MSLFGFPVQEAKEPIGLTVGEIVFGPMDEYPKQAIRNHARAIRESIQGGMLCGMPIDMADVDALIVAAYALGQMATRPKD